MTVCEYVVRGLAPTYGLTCHLNCHHLLANANRTIGGRQGVRWVFLCEQSVFLSFLYAEISTSETTRRRRASEEIEKKI